MKWSQFRASFDVVAIKVSNPIPLDGKIAYKLEGANILHNRLLPEILADSSLGKRPPQVGIHEFSGNTTIPTNDIRAA